LIILSSVATSVGKYTCPVELYHKNQSKANYFKCFLLKGKKIINQCVFWITIWAPKSQLKSTESHTHMFGNFCYVSLSIKEAQTVVAFKAMPLMLFGWMKYQFHSTKLNTFSYNPNTHLVENHNIQKFQ